MSGWLEQLIDRPTRTDLLLRIDRLEEERDRLKAERDDLRKRNRWQADWIAGWAPIVAAATKSGKKP